MPVSLYYSAAVKGLRSKEDIITGNDVPPLLLCISRTALVPVACLCSLDVSRLPQPRQESETISREAGSCSGMEPQLYDIMYVWGPRGIETVRLNACGSPSHQTARFSKVFVRTLSAPPVKRMAGLVQAHLSTAR